MGLKINNKLGVCLVSSFLLTGLDSPVLSQERGFHFKKNRSEEYIGECSKENSCSLGKLLEFGDRFKIEESNDLYEFLRSYSINIPFNDYGTNLSIKYIFNADRKKGKIDVDFRFFNFKQDKEIPNRSLLNHYKGRFDFDFGAKVRRDKVFLRGELKF